MTIARRRVIAGAAPKVLCSVVVVVVCLVAPRPLSATVIYDFSGIKRDTSGTVDTIGFVYTLPDFIVPTVTVPAVDLDSCDPLFLRSCVQVVFEATEFHIDFGPDPMGISSTVTLFDLPTGYLSTPGSYEGDGADTLTVSVQPDTVPEPATLALLGLSLAGLGVRRCRQRARASGGSMAEPSR
jgi:PEP-CTERM motif-containing protein